MRFQFLFIPFFLLFSCVRVSSQNDLDVKKYLYKYGYLSSLDDIDDTVMKAAIKNFQQSVGIKQTGTINKETRELMNKPRCGMPESARIIAKKHGYFIWRTNYLTYKIRNWTEAISEEVIRRTVENSIQLWTRNVNLRIRESSSDHANLNLHFAHIDGRDGHTLAYAYYPQHGGIFFDSSEEWTADLRENSKYFLGQVVTHELGHALGLGHSGSKNSIMYPIYQREIIAPSSIDRNNLISLYDGIATLNKNVICDGKTSIDAMLSYDNVHLAIKDGYYWNFTKNGLKTGPFSLKQLLDANSEKIPKKIDAAFSFEDRIYVFENNVYYKYEKRRFLKKKTVIAGFDNLPGYIDAAFYDPDESVIHFFKHSNYYTFDIKKPIRGRLQTAEISEYWPGISDSIEAATLIEKNKVLFVRKTKCYTFDLKSKKLLKIKDCRNFFKC